MKIRKAVLLDVNGIAKVHVDCWKSTYTNIMPNEYISKQTYEKREKLWQQVIPNGKVFVAEDQNGQIVGFADFGKERTGDYRDYTGEMYAIYILESYQNRGIGKRLMNAVVNELFKQDIHSMLVWVLKDNINSRNFYEHMGGKIVDRKAVDFSDKKLMELAYGWENISAFK